MKARVAWLTGFGGPEVLAVEEIDVADPGAGEVRIKVAAIGLNRIEAIYRAGWFGAPPLPAKIGYEAAGTIEAVGPGVDGYAVGDKAAVFPGVEMPAYGTYGAMILTPVDMLIKLPPETDLIQASASWMKYLTAYAIVWVGKVKAGDTVVITAASSSVGLAAIQIAKAAGATAIATTRGQAKVAALKDAGADHVIVTDEQDLGATIREVTGGTGATIAFDGVGGETAAALTAAMAIGGTLIVYGTFGGDVMPLPAHLLMMGNLAVHGYSTNHLAANPDERARAIAYVHDGLASGKLTPVIDRRFPLAEIADAHRYLEGNAQFGKIIVTVD